MSQHNDEDEWNQLNRTDWRGLGLTDPIKDIEVCNLALLRKCFCSHMFTNVGQMVVTTCVLESQGSGETAH